MAKKDVNKVRHERFWCPRDGTTHIGEDGYLIDPMTWWGIGANPDLTTFDAIADTRCLVLLGEPGIGKSTELQMAHQLQPTDKCDLVAPITDLGIYQSEQLLIEEVFRESVKTEWLNGCGDLYVFLDSLDESLLRTETIAHLLINRLCTLPLDRVYLRIACRTSGWPSDVECMMTDLFDGDIGVYELAPLRKIDVERSAENAGVSAQRFIESVEERAAAPLAGRPVTLNLLLDLFRQNQELPETMATLYEIGCRILCQEPHERRRRSPTLSLRGALNDDERLAVASRVAALMSFSGKTSVWIGPDRGTVPENCISVRDVRGGTEPTGQFTDVEVDTAAVEQALHTALFTSRGSHQIGWAHQTYAEYLAARYLAEHNLPLSQVLSLIISPIDDSERLVPQLHGAAAWLASMHEDVFHPICHRDPLVLLQSDVQSLTDDKRQQLTQALMLQFERGQIVDGYRTTRRWLHKLQHEGLDEVLRPYLLGQSGDAGTRRFAVQIADACKLMSLRDELVHLALDEAADVYSRIWAAYALVAFDDEEVNGRLKLLATGQVRGDDDLELRGIGLRAAWPAHMTSEEVFAALLPPRPGLYGAFRYFVDQHLVAQIRPSDLPAALRWAADQATDHALDNAFDDAIDEILLLSLNQGSDPSLLAGIGRLMVARLNVRGELFTARRSVDSTVYGIDTHRRALVATIVNDLLDSDDCALTLLGIRPYILHSADLHWVIEQILLSTSSVQKEIWATLAGRLFDWTNAKHVDAILVTIETYPDVAERLGVKTAAVDLQSDDAARQRKSYEDFQRFLQRPDPQDAALLDPPPAERVRAALDRAEHGHRAAWIQVVLELTLEATSQRYGDFWNIIDVRTMPGWNEADTLTQKRIQDAALAFLIHEDPKIDQWLGTNTILKSAIAGMKAFFLLHSEKDSRLSSMPQSAWHRWSPVLIEEMPGSGVAAELAVRYDILCFAYSQSQTTIADALLQHIDRRNRDDQAIDAIGALNTCWDSRLTTLTIDWLQDNQNVSPTTLRSLVSQLLAVCPSEIGAYARDQLTRPASLGSPTRARALAAAQALVLDAADAGWAHVWTAVVADASFGIELFPSVASSFQWRSSRSPLGDRIGEHDLADLFLWLSEHFPADEDPPSEVHEITPQEDLQRFRRSIINQLAGKGTTTACNEIERIVQERPDQEWLGLLLEGARAQARHRQWKPPSPQEIRMLVASRQLRLVNNGGQLSAVLVESLHRLQKNLHDETPAVRDIWDKLPNQELYRPVDENTFSDYVKRHLDRDLRERGVIVNREVQIRRTERTDIHVDAVAPASGAYDRITVIIEAKGSWHPELRSAMQTQLVERYLRDNECDHGLYLVGWFTSGRWDPDDYRKGATERFTIGFICEQLRQQAASLSNDGIAVEAFVLDAELR